MKKIKTNNNNHLPLVTLFTRLREAGLSIGIDEYQLALAAMQQGFGVANYEDLKSVCQALWVKSEDDLYRFNYHFDKVMEAEFAALRGQQSAKLAKRRKMVKIIRIISLVGLVLAGVGIAFWFNNLGQNVSPPLSECKEPPCIEIPVTTGLLTPEIWILLSIVVLIVLAIVIWLITQRMMGTPSEQENDSSPTKQSGSVSDKTKTDKEESAEFLAMSQPNSRVDEVFGDRQILSADYFPVTRRQMKQSWRYLRRRIRSGPPTELDLTATVDQISRQGVLLDPVLRPPQVNQTELIILIDRDGSMVPFHALSQRLAETALKGGRLGKANIYYFYNCPVENLYCDPNYQVAEAIPEILNRLGSNRAGVLIISDGGAARGRLNLERIELTETFLMQFKQRVRNLVWLNPVPRDRWSGTTAEIIAELLPMFELSRRGLDNAIRVLRGQTV